MATNKLTTCNDCIKFKTIQCDYFLTMNIKPKREDEICHAFVKEVVCEQVQLNPSPRV